MPVKRHRDVHCCEYNEMSCAELKRMCIHDIFRSGSCRGFLCTDLKLLTSNIAPFEEKKMASKF